jgi:hypothetical protein
MMYPDDEPEDRESESDEGGEIDVFAANLVEDRTAGSPTQNHVADALAAAVGHCFDRITARENQSDEITSESTLKVTLQEATSVAVGALEGKLKASSLDGALRQAQIVESYAKARESNALAALHQTQNAQIQQEMAWQQLEKTIGLIQSLGGSVSLIRLPDGRFGLTIGGDLAAELPFGAGSQRQDQDRIYKAG